MKADLIMPTWMTDIYREYVDLSRQMHALFLEGLEESPGADLLRERMDTLWEELDDDQREMARGVASDLNWIQRGNAPNNKRTEKEILDEDLPALSLARKAAQWRDVLKYARRCVAYLQPAPVAYLRGRGWLMLGDSTTALLFFKHARKLEPENGGFAYAELDCAARLHPERVKAVLEDDLHHLPAEVVKAVDIRRQNSSQEERKAESLHSITILKRSILRMSAVADDEWSSAFRAMAWGLLGFCYTDNDRIEDAQLSLDEAIAIQPNSDGWLIARGTLLYGRDTAQAIVDFNRAVSLRSRMVWPYLFLAHNHLLNERFANCLASAGRALKLQASNEIKATLLGWIAICESELGFPVDSARASFAKAMELSPENARLRQNFMTFESSLARFEAPPASWNQEDEVTMGAMGKAVYELAMVA